MSYIFITKDGIGERIRKVLDDCWERRDSSGGIADPEGNTGILRIKNFRIVGYCHY